MDGEIQERKSGEQKHAIIQALLTYMFMQNRKKWNIEVYPELRVQVSENNYQRVDDYLRFGTEHVWVIDPELRKAYICSSTGFQEPQQAVLRIPGTPIEAKLNDVFSELDRA